MATAATDSTIQSKRDELLARIEQARLTGQINPPEPAARIHSRQQFEQRMMDDFPGQYVAYRERWNGDELLPEVLGKGGDYGEIQLVLDRLVQNPNDRIKTIYPADIFQV